MGASWIHGTTNNPLMDLARKAQAQLVSTDYYGWAKLAVDPRLQPLDYHPQHWRQFVEHARDRVDGGSLGAAVDAAAASAELSDSDHARLAFYIATEIEDEYAASADQLSAKTFDSGDYTRGDQDVVTSGYDALPRMLADGLQIALNTPVTAIARRDSSVMVRAKRPLFRGTRRDRHSPSRCAEIRCYHLRPTSTRRAHPRGECPGIRRAVQKLLSLQRAHLGRRERLLSIHRN
jgi:Flavin containing amine oxidoreductase